MSTFVLVHGHWHGPWCWSRLVDRMAERGQTCITPELPCTEREAGTATNAEVVLDAMKDLGDDVVLVGHSAGGLTIPLVAARRSVRHLVFIAGLLPVVGKSLAQQFSDDPEIIEPAFEYIDEGDGFCSIDPRKAKDFFYNDCTDADASWAISRLRRQTTLTITEATPLREWPSTPCSYIFGDQDHVLQPGWEAKAPRERLGVDSTVIPGAGHSPFLSRPDEVADLLIDAAARGGGNHDPKG